MGADVRKQVDKKTDSGSGRVGNSVGCECNKDAVKLFLGLRNCPNDGKNLFFKVFSVLKTNCLKNAETVFFGAWADVPSCDASLIL